MRTRMKWRNHKAIKSVGEVSWLGWNQAAMGARGVRLVLLAGALLALTLTLHAVDADLLVVLLEGREILTSLGELSLLHTLADVPVHERALRVHEIELVVQAGPGLGDGGRVAQHADRALHLREVAA